MISRRALLGGAAATTLGAAVVLPRLRRTATPRAVADVLPAVATKDGAGVRLRRALGHQALRMLDPFLLLDEFKSDDPNDYIAGFPDHPHRGFETVTIMRQGAMEHRDSVGNRGLLGPGSVQWMTAGRGIVHSEMPRQVSGTMWGFQLWVNLPARLKMTKPRYQDLGIDAVPEVDQGDAVARVLAGTVGGVTGPVADVIVQPTVLDVTMQGGGFVHDLPGGHTAIAYVTDGEAVFDEAGEAVGAGSLVVLGPGDAVVATGDARFLLIAGAPIGEPVARRGPFVMNTEDEIRQAYEDYRNGRLVDG